ncbi:MAG: AAA family ATPase [Alphaproteobacteria bacterium]
MIKNFRCLEDLTIQKLGHVNLIVGANNSGKSTILEALRIYAGELADFRLFFDLLSARDEFIPSHWSAQTHIVQSYQDHPARSLFTNRAIEKNKKIEIGDINSLQNGVIVEGEFEHLGEFYVGLKVVSKYNGLERSTAGISLLHLGSYVGDKKATSPYKDGYVSSQLPSTDDQMALFAEINREYGDNQILTDALKIIEPRIINVFFDPIDQICFVKHQDFQKTIPLKTLGEGMMRILQLALFIPRAQKTGFLLIDEFENGLYWRTQSKIWEFLFEIAKRYNIQIFATTHSKDTINSFAKIALSRKDMEGVLISLDRSAAKKDNNKIIAIEYDEESLANIIEDNIEVR